MNNVKKLIQKLLLFVPGMALYILLIGFSNTSGCPPCYFGVVDESGVISYCDVNCARSIPPLLAGVLGLVMTSIILVIFTRFHDKKLYIIASILFLLLALTGDLIINQVYYT